ncbi:MAG: NosD domain-containing protein [Promethearchaeota archaeon]
MDVKLTKKYFFILICLTFSVLPIYMFSSNDSKQIHTDYNYDIIKPKMSGVYEDILIDDLLTTNTENTGNWTWASTQPWCTGGPGDQGNPYIIEGQTFNFNSGSGECLTISNSRKHFIIRNCIIKNSNSGFAGFYLNNASNGQILTNDIFNNGLGIILLYVNDTIISNNDVYNTDSNGIYLQYSYSNTISGNIVYNNSECGIHLKNSAFNVLAENVVYNNSWSGDVELTSGIFVRTSTFNVLKGNVAYNNSNHGIYLKTSDLNNLTGNEVYNNSINGIYLRDSDLNNLSGNVVYNNTEEGVYLLSCENNTLLDNSLASNYDYGFKISSSHNNTISENIVNDNIQFGMYILASADNTISQNSIQNNGIGGIRIETSDSNEIHENKIWGNTYIGVYLDDGDTKSDYNLLYYNFFIGNGIHAFDGPGNTDNNWNNTDIGNYWDNLTGPDNDNDGIVDPQYGPYNITGSTQSKDYLPIAEDGAPRITIYSPIHNYVYSVVAPSFNVLITDIYVDTMWYTLDGGVANYFFTDKGMIDQSMWDAMPEGNYTLTFYASDIIYRYYQDEDHIGSASIKIIKDYETPIIHITSPTSGKVFGINAPSFNVSITEDYLSTMWYTLDTGLHNYTFTGNGTINQSAWDAMGEGNLILQFYANDSLGHIGTAGVNITKDTQPPIIIINSPTDGDKFSNNAPTFNITIIEENLEIILYSFDEGLNNHTIINNGTFDQTAWTNLSQGDVKITFYAKDLAGNEASESVTVIKSIPSGLDPGVIITIVIVSVVGGVAVVAGVYIFMKKRATPE